jgi:hypothetical protein
MLPGPTTHKGLRSGPSSMDDEKDSSDRPTSLVGDGNTYRDTLSHPRAAHTIGQGLRTLNPMDTTVLKRSNEKSPGATTCIPPGVIEDSASAHEGHSPLKYSLTAHTSADMTCLPNKGRQPSMAVGLSGTCLHPDIKSSCRMTDASSPVEEGPPSSTTGQPLARKAVSEEEMSIIQCSPVPSAALTLPNHLFAFSMRTESSRPPDGELKSTPLIVQERHDPGDVVGPGTEIGIDAYRAVAPNVPLSTGLHPAEVLQPGVDSPSPGEIQSSQPPDEATTETQRSEVKMVVNARQSKRKCLPTPKVTHTLPTRPPVTSI